MSPNAPRSARALLARCAGKFRTGTAVPRNNVQTYAIAVCVAAVLVSAAFTGLLLLFAVRWAMPWYTWEAPSEYYFGVEPPIVIGPVGGTPAPEMPQEHKKRERIWWQQSLEVERDAGKRGVNYWGIGLLVSVTLYGVHWRLLSRQYTPAV